MDRKQAVGYALIIIGVVLGIEGTAMVYLGLMGLNEIGQAFELAAISGAIGLESFYRSMQTAFTALTAYSLAKTVAGIACMLLGYKALEKK